MEVLGFSLFFIGSSGRQRRLETSSGFGARERGEAVEQQRPRSGSWEAVGQRSQEAAGERQRGKVRGSRFFWVESQAGELGGSGGQRSQEGKLGAEAGRWWGKSSWEGNQGAEARRLWESWAGEMAVEAGKPGGKARS